PVPMPIPGLRKRAPSPEPRKYRPARGTRNLINRMEYWLGLLAVTRSISLPLLGGLWSGLEKQARSRTGFRLSLGLRRRIARNAYAALRQEAENAFQAFLRVRVFLAEGGCVRGLPVENQVLPALRAGVEMQVEPDTFERWKLVFQIIDHEVPDFFARVEGELL